VELLALRDPQLVTVKDHRSPQHGPYMTDWNGSGLWLESSGFPCHTLLGTLQATPP